MFNRWTINFGTARMSNGQFLAYANRIVSFMTGNLNYPTPVPTLLAVSAAVTTYSNALTAYGTTPGNRGTSSQKSDLDNARTALEEILAELSWYCQSVTAFDKNAFLSGGWNVKSEPMPVGMLGMVENLEQVLGETIPSGSVKLRWKRPLTAKPGNVAAYRVLHSLTADVNTATQLAVITQTNYTDLLAATRPSNFYWVIPIGTAGEGLISDVVVAYPVGPVI